MATGGELVKRFIKFVHSKYALAIIDFDESLDNDLTTTDQAITEIVSKNIPVQIKNLIECFFENNITNNFMVDSFVTPSSIEIIDFTSQDYLKRNRSFNYADGQFGFLSIKKMAQFGSVSLIMNDQEGYRTIVDAICGLIDLGESIKLDSLIRVVELLDTNKGVLVRKIASPDTSISIYSYLYLSKLLSGSAIEIDPSLNYSGFVSRTTPFVSTLRYEQYFELLDVGNEITHSRDILTRFLKIYQMLEYMVYRVELVKLESKARINRTFIREIHGLVGNGASEKEWSIFKKNFILIFDTEIKANHFSFGNISIQQQNFLKNHFDLNSYNPKQGSNVAQLIYRLRNSIVHNKESEFHMTITNPDDYRDIVSMINMLIQKLEKAIYDKIISNNINIRYGSNSIQLY